MKWSNDYKMRLVLAGFVAAVVLGSGSAKADFTFGTPMNLGPTINGPGIEGEVSLSHDGRELYFVRTENDVDDIWVARRTTPDSEWGPPSKLGPVVNSSGYDKSPCISADGLSLYFGSDRPGGFGDLDLWVTTRPTMDDNWGAPINLGSMVNSSSFEYGESLSADGLELYFTSTRPGGYGAHDIWVTRRETVRDEWCIPDNLGPTINTSTEDAYPSISSDGLLLFLWSNRLGGYGNRWDLYMARRATPKAPWGTPTNLGPTVNSTYFDNSPHISADGSMLYFHSNRPGGFGAFDIWQAPIIPIVDFNRDGIVDAADVCIMIEHWLTDYPLCDIGPMPWGDGIVDVQDLIVLAEHLFEDYRLVGHWALDEEQGSIAYDSAGRYDADLHGGPLWQPSGGKVTGALQFDGIDDYVSTPFILNPAKGSLTVSAWIKGGAPGQVVISQRDAGRDPGNTWLLADASYGRLMTRLMHPPFPPLVSESVITDDQWHHVGLVYDIVGLHRYLYVDGTEVAKDSDFVGGVGSDGGLYIGADKTLDAAGFFSGLIDDVRIYNNVLSAEEIAALAR